jgi:uncharacterized protein
VRERSFGLPLVRAAEGSLSPATVGLAGLHLLLVILGVMPRWGRWSVPFHHRGLPVFQSPCLSCGACCAFYRASFYWAEADDATENGVPVDLTAKRNEVLRVMRGTETKPCRCVALEGTIGQRVRCTIHPRRSSVCREFDAAWQFGEPHDRCDRARAAWGLPPLTIDDWMSEEDRFPYRSDQPEPSDRTPAGAKTPEAEEEWPPSRMTLARPREVLYRPE